MSKEQCWSGFNSYGESWYFSPDGQEQYWDQYDNSWQQLPNGEIYYYDKNGDYSITYTNGTNVFFESLPSGGYDYYNYQPSGA